LDYTKIKEGGLSPFTEVNMEKLEIPLNAQERYMYNICVRLDALIHMMSSFVEVYANQNNITTTNNEVKDETPKPKRTKK
jgi:hypothetical protein